MKPAPVESTGFRVRYSCEIWKRSGRRCPSCKLRYRRVIEKAARR